MLLVQHIQDVPHADRKIHHIHNNNPNDSKTYIRTSPYMQMNDAYMLSMMNVLTHHHFIIKRLATLLTVVHMLLPHDECRLNTRIQKVQQECTS